MMLLGLLSILLAESSAVTPAKMRPHIARHVRHAPLPDPVTSARAQDAVPDSFRESSSTDAELVDDVVNVLLAWRQTGAFDSESPDNPNLMLDLALDLAATDLALDLAATDPALDLAAIDLAWTETRLASAAIVGRLRSGESRVEAGY